MEYEMRTTAGHRKNVRASTASVYTHPSAYDRFPDMKRDGASEDESEEETAPAEA